VASVEQCEIAFGQLADRLAAVDERARKSAMLDRSVSCKLTDLEVIFAGRLSEEGLSELRQVEQPDAQIRIELSSDDLIKLTAGELNFVSAWGSGRIRIDANVLDLLKLRSML
jgi:hypothetical protein